MDEGYLDVGEVAADFGDARARRRGGAGRGARGDEPDLRARRRLLQGRRQDRERPPQAGRPDRRPGRAARRRSSRRSTCAGCPESARAPRSACAAGGVETIGDLAALADDEPCARCCRASSARCCATAPAASTRGRSSSRSRRISISAEETFQRDVADVERLQDELRRLAEHVAERLHARGQTGRTVTTKLRYPDFSIRSRSTTVPVGIDDAERIWELACALLDRALADRPGAAAAARRRRLRASRRTASSRWSECGSARAWTTPDPRPRRPRASARRGRSRRCRPVGRADRAGCEHECPPIRDQEGLEVKFGGKSLPPGRLVRFTTRRSPEPSCSIRYREPVASAMNAISAPSGDQLGRAAPFGPILLLSEPLAFITWRCVSLGGGPLA